VLAEQKLRYETALSRLQGEIEAVAKSDSPTLAAFNAEIASVRALTAHMLGGNPRPFRRPQPLPKRSKN